MTNDYHSIHKIDHLKSYFLAAFLSAEYLQLLNLLPFRFKILKPLLIESYEQKKERLILILQSGLNLYISILLKIKLATF
jgi:hypothetical protein